MTTHAAPTRFRRAEPLIAVINLPVLWAVEHAADRIARAVVVFAVPVFVLLSMVAP